jgi:hypothetical protein
MVFVDGACEDVEQPGFHVRVDLEEAYLPIK